MKIAVPTLALAGLLLAPAAQASPDALDRRVSLDLQDVTAAEAFGSLARVAGVQVDLDGLADEKVSLELENVRVKTLLTALCESLGCRWELADGKPPRLRIVADPAGHPPARVKPSQASLDAQIDLKVKDARVRDLLETVAQITSTRPFIDSAVQGSISLELENTAVRTVLDTICQTAKCTWSFDADKAILVVRPKAQT
jgi:regulator of replication initiation timing